MTAIVVVEDETDIGDLLALYFRQEGWTVHVADNGADGLEVIRARRPDFIVLDVGLPGELDGFDVCREVRRNSNTPILFLTARDDEIDRILGLEIGADDYVTKPFSPARSWPGSKPSCAGARTTRLAPTSASRRS